MASRNIQLPSSTLARPSLKKILLKDRGWSRTQSPGFEPYTTQSMMLYAHNLSIQEGLGVQGYIGKT